MSRRKKLTKTEKAGLIFTLIVLLLANAYYQAKDHRLTTALESFAFATAIIFWLIAFRMPTKCGVATIKGRPCRIPVRGVIFGCHNHKWDKVFARLGRRRFALTSPDLPQPNSQMPGQPGMPPPGPVVIHVEESGKNNAAFYLGVIAAGATVLSAITGVVALH